MMGRDVSRRRSALDAAFHMPTYARKPVMFVRGDGHAAVRRRRARSTSTSSRASARSTSATRTPRWPRRSPSRWASSSRSRNLYYVEHRDELAEVLVGLHRRRSARCSSRTRAPRRTRARSSSPASGARRGAATSCVGIVTAERSFHGRTLATLAATGQPSKQEAFAPLLRRLHARAAQRHRARSRPPSTSETCAVMLEPIQGEGGVFPCTPGYLADVQRLCDERERAAHPRRGADRLLPHGRRVRAPARRVPCRPRHRDAAPRRSPTACRSGRSSRRTRWRRRSSRATTARRSAAARSCAPPRSPRSARSSGEDLGGNAERDGRLPPRRSSTRIAADTAAHRRDPRRRASCSPCSSDSPARRRSPPPALGAGLRAQCDRAAYIALPPASRVRNGGSRYTSVRPSCDTVRGRRHADGTRREGTTCCAGTDILTLGELTPADLRAVLDLREGAEGGVGGGRPRRGRSRARPRRSSS